MKQGKIKLLIGILAAIVSVSVIGCFDDSKGLKTLPGSSGESDPDTDAYLEYLNIAEVAVTPVFNSNVTSYNTIVDHVGAGGPTTLDVTAIGLEYTEVTVDGVEVNSLNDFTATVLLEVDRLDDDPLVESQDIDIVVTAEDGITTSTYTITVVMDEMPSTNNNLASLSLTAYSGATEVTPVIWTPDPGGTLPGQQTFDVDVPYNTNKVYLTATVEDSEAEMTIDGESVTSGDEQEIDITGSPQDIVVEVISESGTSKTYTITVAKGAAPDDESRLSSLGLTSGGTWSSDFDPDTTSYTVEYSDEIPGEMSTIDVTPTAMDSDATITVDGVIVTSGSTETVTLTADPQSIIINVKAEDYDPMDDPLHETNYVITVQGGSGCGG